MSRSEKKEALLRTGIANKQKATMDQPATAVGSSAADPPLGVSVYHLKQVLLKNKICGCGAADSTTGKLLSASSKIHEIENLQGPPGVIRQSTMHKTCPIDGKVGAAYVHSLDGASHVGEATHMLSYSWR